MEKNTHVTPSTPDQDASSKEAVQSDAASPLNDATETESHGATTLANNEEAEYPSGLKLGLIVLALCLSVFLIALDNAIIATAVPQITNEFRSLADAGWYGSAYLLTTAALQLLFGKFYVYFPIKWVYLTAILLFEAGSLICGVAQNSVTLIAGRAVAGIGAAGIMSGALLILAHSVPLVKRPMYAGMIGSMYGIASVAGPLLGGVFTDRVTWRWCFFINLPIGAITVAVIVFFFPEPTRDYLVNQNLNIAQRIMQFDPLGNILFMPAITCLLLALHWGGTTYAWNSGRIVALLVVFAVLLVGFIFVQHRQQENATVPPRIVKNRTVWASCLYIFFLGSAFYLMVYFMPVWFQSVQGATAIESGTRNLPVLISVVVFAIIAGAGVTALGYYAPFMILGTVLLSTGAGLISTFTVHTPSSAWIGYQIIFGAGVGLGMQQPLMAIQNALDLKDVPTGTSMITFLQTLGGALFIIVAQSVFTSEVVRQLEAALPSLDPSVILNTGATELQNSLPAESLPAIKLAYNEALARAFLVATALGAASILGSALIPWRSMKKTP
ncbi:MFS multidrug transporter [Stachybotrys elegans]|uniref:MFS multidrug transporter n=1 Tax=Stachybotrys elegans TaxID=80388 RepID=A0A8K0WTS5_9HYPO|nr:MFS multidrug transporter [Stachybotrys elegans]